MDKGFFITGTDTGVGKTWFTVLFMRYWQQQGLKVNGMKPIASGAEREQGQLVNEDALAIIKNSSSKPDYELVNPCVYEPPVAPHIAAQKSNEPISLDKIQQAYQKLMAESDLLLVEGVGGWRVPIDNQRTLVDMVKVMNLPVILVVGLRLGCINHAILSAEAVIKDGLPFYGWVLSEIDENYLYKKETLLTLEQALGSPCLAEVPHQKTNDPAKAVLNIHSIPV